MSTQLEDCHFFLNAICAYGSDCKFRHCQEAINNEICKFWIKDACTRIDCKFRHPKKIYCLYEETPGGCFRSQCRYLHKKSQARIFIAASETISDVTIGAKPNSSQSPRAMSEQDNVSMPSQGQDVSPVVEPVVVSLNEAEDLGIKTLEQIKMDKLHREPGNFYHTIKIDEEPSTDLRALLQRKRKSEPSIEHEIPKKKEARAAKVISWKPPTRHQVASNIMTLNSRLEVTIMPDHTKTDGRNNSESKSNNEKKPSTLLKQLREKPANSSTKATTACLKTSCEEVIENGLPHLERNNPKLNSVISEHPASNENCSGCIFLISKKEFCCQCKGSVKCKPFPSEQQETTELDESWSIFTDIEMVSNVSETSDKYDQKITGSAQAETRFEKTDDMMMSLEELLNQEEK